MSQYVADLMDRVVSSSTLLAPYAVAVSGIDGSVAELAAGRIDRDSAMSTTTVMYGASLAKQVVGMLLAQECTHGRINLDDSLSTHLDGFPSWADRVRIRHLVHHTSGLTAIRPVGHQDDNAETMRRLRSSSGPVIEPGGVFAYSNVGYVCLTEVLRSITGERPEEIAAARLFRPFGMTTARLGGPMPSYVGQQRPPATVGDGGFWLSAEDLRRWNDAMNVGALGDDVHSLAERPGQLDDGTPLDYAWGMRVFVHDGHRTISHGGSWPTWSAKAVRVPDLEISVALMSTSDDAATMTRVALELVSGLRQR